MINIARNATCIQSHRRRNLVHAALAAGVLLCVLAASAALHGPNARALDTNLPDGSAVARPSGAANAQGSPAQVHGVSMTVSDLDRSIEFYTRVLDFRVDARDEHAGDGFERLTGVFGASARAATLRLGEECLELVEYRTPGGRPIPADSRSNDRWFQHIAIAVSDMDAAFSRLSAARVRFASSAPQTLPAWNPNAGGIAAFYFRDPDNHVLEVIHFPAGKGDPRWQQSAGRVFLGIDHTAIVVADTEASLRFYRDALGLRVVGGSENSGVEQEHLNNVFGAHLRITTLRGGSGPGVELLEYLSPTTGRDMPRDSTAADLWHWHISIEAASAGVEASLRAARAAWVSAPPAGERTAQGLFRVRDPDGHVCQIDVRAAHPEGEYP